MNSEMPAGDSVVRDARPEDLPGILTIYNDVILNTMAVYTEQPATLRDRQQWYSDRQRENLPVLVAVRGNEILGFGSFGAFRPLPCYARSVEHSVHVASDARRLGIGRSIVQALIERAIRLNKRVMVGGIDASNAGSIALHRSLGFEEAGTIREVACKFGRLLDLTYMRKGLNLSPAKSAEPGA